MLRRGEERRGGRKEGNDGNGPKYAAFYVIEATGMYVP